MHTWKPPKLACDCCFITILVVSSYILVQLLFFTQPNPVDDSFITLSYSKNLASGNGLVFGSGERVFGSTTPLFAVLLGLLGAIFRTTNMPLLALYFNALMLVANAILIYILINLIDKRLRIAGMAAAVLLLLHQDCLAACRGGMELLFLTALILGAFTFVLLKHEYACGFLLGLAQLTRPEGVLAAGIAMIGWWLLWHRTPWKMIFVCVLTIIPWVIFATLYFGSPIPHNLIVKLNAFNHYSGQPFKTLGKLIFDINRVLEIDRILFMFEQYRSTGQISSQLLTAVKWLLPSVTLIFSTLIWVRNKYSALLVIGFLAAFYSLHGIGNKLYFPWYRLIPIPFLMMVYAGGIGTLLLKLGGNKTQTRKLRTGITVLIITTFISLSLTRHFEFRTNHAAFNSVQGDSMREGMYKKAAEFLNARDSIVQRVALPEIGVLGYYLHHKTIDLVGLVTPEVLPLRMEGKNYGEIAEEFEPKYIVSYVNFLSLFNSAEFFQQYREIASFGKILVFERTLACPLKKDNLLTWK